MSTDNLATVKIPIVKCYACNGTGTNSLTAPLLRTLNALNANGPLSIPDIYKTLQESNLHPSAINQRIKKLLKLGLVNGKSERGVMIYRKSL